MSSMYGALLLPKRSGHESGRRILIPALRKNLRSGRVTAERRRMLTQHFRQKSKDRRCTQRVLTELAKCLFGFRKDLVCSKRAARSSSPATLMSVAWQPARNPRRKPSNYSVRLDVGKKMPLPSRRTSKMTTKSLPASSRMMQPTFRVSRRQS